MGELIAFRGRAIGFERDNKPKEIDDEFRRTADPEALAMAEKVNATHTQMRREMSAAQDKRSAIAEKRFGADGRGFLDELNSGEALKDFWGTLDTLLCQRISLMEYHAPEEFAILRDLLARFPERVWLPIIAQKCWPLLEHRQFEHHYELMDRYLASDRADFRHLETGPSKPESEDDLSSVVKDAFIKANWGWHTLFARFKGMAFEPMLESFDEQIKRAQENADMLRNPGPADLNRMQIELVEELFREMEPAKTHDAGLVQSEINMNKRMSFAHAMRALMPGREEGYYLREALSSTPQGFRRLNLGHYPRKMVSPYIATHLDIMDRAMGLVAPFWFEPKLEQAKAIALLKLLPKVPARYLEILCEVATGKGRAGRDDARALLAGVPQALPLVLPLLEDKAAAVREQAARTLGAIGDKSTLPALVARQGRETAKKAQGALIDAIDMLGGAAPDDGPDLEAFCREAELGASKKLTKKREWLNDLHCPPLLLHDGTQAPGEAGPWLLRFAAEHGSPEGSAQVEQQMACLDADSSGSFGEWVLAAWIGYDSQDWPAEMLAERRRSFERGGYHQYLDMRERYARAVKEGWPEYFREHFTDDPTVLQDEPISLDEWAARNPEHADYWMEREVNWNPYPFSAIGAVGVLALAHMRPGNSCAMRWPVTCAITASAPRSARRCCDSPMHGAARMRRHSCARLSRNNRSPASDSTRRSC